MRRCLAPRPPLQKAAALIGAEKSLEIRGCFGYQDGAPGVPRWLLPSARSDNSVWPGWKGLEEAPSCSSSAPALPVGTRQQLCKLAPRLAEPGLAPLAARSPGTGPGFSCPSPGAASLSQPTCFLSFIFPLLPATRFSFLFLHPAPPGCGEIGKIPVPSCATRLV